MSFCCILTSTYASSDVFDGVLGETASCHKTCQMTYSLHTYPRVSARHATSHGCLLTKKRYWDVKPVVSLRFKEVVRCDVRTITTRKAELDAFLHLACLFCFRRRRCTPVREDVVSSPSVSSWVTARISTKPKLNASQVILKRRLSLISVLIVCLLLNQLNVFDFLQPVVKPTPSQRSSTRAI